MAAANRLTFGKLKSLLVSAWTEFNDDNAPRLGAALAYYTILSIAPLLVVVIAIAGLAFGKEAAEGQIYAQIDNLVGHDGAKAIQGMIRGASDMGQGLIASLIGVIALLFGATSVVAELRNALNVVWDVPQKNEESGIKQVVKERSYALAVVLACGFLLLVSLVLSAVLSAAGTFMQNVLPLPEPVLHAFNLLVSIAVITGVFALLFRFLPDADIPWSDVLLGAAFTAILFTIGKFLIGMYLGKASFGSTYGAAGSLVIVLVWVYYSSQILFFGAEFTQVYARDYGTDPAGKRSPSPVEARPEPVREYAGRAAGGGAALPAADRGRTAVISAGLLVGLFAAAGRELQGLLRRRNGNDA